MGHGIKTPIYQVGYKFLDSDPESIIHEGKIDLLILVNPLTDPVNGSKEEW